MEGRILITCALVLVACEREGASRLEDSVPPGLSATAAPISIKTSSKEESSDLSRPAEAGSQPAVSGSSERRVNEIVSQLFGDSSQYGEEELQVVRFMEGYLDRYDPKFTKKRRFVVRKRDSGWDVDVINVQVILEGGRDGGLKFRVSKRGGRLRVVDSPGH